jgi:anti-sigma-K factor RskA
VSVTHEPFDTLAALHAVGALDGDDLQEFEAHLATGCTRCRTLVRQTEQALARAAMAGPPEPPPAAVRQTLVSRAARAGSPGRRRWLPWALGIGVTAIVAGALSAAYVAARYEARLGQMARETAAARERLAQSEAAVREEVDAHRAAIELLRDPGTRVVELRGQGDAAAAVGRLFLTERNGGLLLATKLPPPPPGRIYTLWTATPGATRSAGTFVPDATGRATLKVTAEAASAPARVLSVTLEPESGTPAPSGAVVLAPR